MFGWFTRPLAFRPQMGQTGKPCIELPGIEPGREKAVLRALGGMGRVRIRSKSNDFGHVTIEFVAGFGTYSLQGQGGVVYIRGEEIARMLAFMRKSGRFAELGITRKK